jgi:hypothetical protein
MAIAHRHGHPVDCIIANASSHETKPVQTITQQRFTCAQPNRMIGDRTDDSDPSCQRMLQDHRIQPTARHKYNGRLNSTQGGRELRRCY